MQYENPEGVVSHDSWDGIFFSKSVSAEVTVVSPNEFDISLIYPLGLALTIAFFLWRVFLPRQLSNLQVVFEIDDNLYEVHRLSKDVKGKELLAYDPFKSLPDCT